VGDKRGWGWFKPTLPINYASLQGVRIGNLTLTILVTIRKKRSVNKKNSHKKFKKS